jgi:hypothetical protein
MMGRLPFASIAWTLTFASPAYADCKAVSPGSSIVDCRTEAQITQEIDERAKRAEERKRRIDASNKQRELRASASVGKPHKNKEVSIKEGVDSAYKLCRTLDATGLPSQKCEVSSYTINLSLDIAPSEARNLCPELLQFLDTNDHFMFDPGWSLRIYSPFSGSRPIATCQIL